MNLKLEKNTLVVLKIAAVLSTVVVLLHEVMSNESIFNSYFYFFSASIFGYIFIVFNSMMLTNSKGLINFGAFASLVVGLIILGNTIFTLLSGDDIKIIFSDDWTTYLYLTQIFVACVAGLYLSFEVERKLKPLERIGLVVLIPIFMVIQGMSPGKNEKLFDAFGINMFVSIATVTVVGLIVLYFSNLQHSIALPLIGSLLFLVANARSVHDYFSPEKHSDSDYVVYAADRTSITIVQLGISVLLVAYCLFIVWRMSVMGQKAGRVPSLEQLLNEKNNKGPGIGVGPLPGVGPSSVPGSSSAPGAASDPFSNPGQGTRPGPDQAPPPANPIW